MHALHRLSLSVIGNVMFDRQHRPINLYSPVIETMTVSD